MNQPIADEFPLADEHIPQRLLATAYNDLRARAIAMERLTKDAFEILAKFDYESDTDDFGPALFTALIDEDFFFYVKNRIEKSITP